VAALQPTTYQIAAELGIGVMALSVAAPSYLAPHIKQYKERVRQATPVGKFINDQWLSATMAICDWDSKSARELAARSLRTFFGPDRPYLKDQTHLYEQLVESWARSRPPCGIRSTPTRSWTAACWWRGDPDSCLRSIAIHEEAGVDELQFLMATESVPHDKVMSSIAMFGKHVIPELRRKSAG
jgi:hypothetical protein